MYICPRCKKTYGLYLKCPDCHTSVWPLKVIPRRMILNTVLSNPKGVVYSLSNGQNT